MQRTVVCAVAFGFGCSAHVSSNTAPKAIVMLVPGGPKFKPLKVSVARPCEAASVPTAVLPARLATLGCA